MQASLLNLIWDLHQCACIADTYDLPSVKMQALCFLTLQEYVLGRKAVEGTSARSLRI